MRTTVSLSIGALLCATAACGEAKVDLRVRVEYPASYATRPAAGATVTVVTAGAARTATTGDDGEARFDDVFEGSYELRVERALTASEAEALTGHAQSVALRSESTLRVTSGTQRTSVELRGPRLGGWVLREVYYSGSPGVGGNHYFSDQFVEIYNNSTETLYADGLYLGDAHGPAGAINPSTPPTPFGSELEHVYLENVWRVPGSGRELAVAPGEGLVIAHDGTNHMPFSPLDLSDADFEAYNEREDRRDNDSPTVPNLERVVFNGGFDWLWPVFGGSLVLFHGPAVEQLETVTSASAVGPLVRVPVADVEDGVDALMNGESGRYKRLPAAVDATFNYVSGTYVGESLRRRVQARVGTRLVYRDTNDSAADFERLTTPTPRAR